MAKIKLLVSSQSPLGKMFRAGVFAAILLPLASVLAQTVARDPGVTSPGENSLQALTRLSDAQTRRVSSTSPDLNSNGDSRVIKEGQTLVLAELTGPRHHAPLEYHCLAGPVLRPVARAADILERDGQAKR